MHYDLEGVNEVEGATTELIAALHRQLVEESLREAKAVEELRARLAAIHAEHESSLRRLATDRQWEKYQRLHRRRVRLMAKLRERVGESPEAVSELAEARHASIERSRELFEREGIDVEAIRRIHKQRNDALTAAFEEFLGRELPLQGVKGRTQHGT